MKFRRTQFFLIITAFLSICDRNDSTNTGEDSFEEPFSITFLGRTLDFYLNDNFSAKRIAVEFCERESRFDEEDSIERNVSSSKLSQFSNHVVAVRDLIENTVASQLGPDRIEAAFDGKDPVAYKFIQSVCRDFPQNHDMPYRKLNPRTSPLRIIDGDERFPHALNN